MMEIYLYSVHLIFIVTPMLQKFSVSYKFLFFPYEKKILR